MQQDAQLPLSVIIATKLPWPHIKPCLESVVDQARAVGAEVILADGGGQALPASRHSALRDVVWLELDRASSYRLRLLALAHARGKIIAITEDHCQVRPGWCTNIIQSHAEHPEAAAIGGGVENGSRSRLVDWATFFIANGPFMLPIENGKSQNISLQANISYKRRALIDDETPPDLGLMEMLYNRTLLDQGKTLLADDSIVVDHVQSISFVTHCALHFHNGRSIAGYRLPTLRLSARVARIASCAILPTFLLARTLVIVLRKRQQRVQLVLALPFISLFSCCHAAGELLGYFAGAGNSPQYEHIG